jgi:hypothetical protein
VTVRKPIRKLFAVACVTTVTILSGCGSSLLADAPAPDAICVLEHFERGDGVHFGVNLDWENQTVSEYADLLGAPPASVVSFVPFPWTSLQREWVTEAAQQASRAGAVHLLTLEPNDGLAAVTGDALAELRGLLEEVTDAGAPVLVRFAHEMNGSWYAWGQQPAEYIEAFRAVADVVHDVPGTATMWAPNYGGGYPFAGGAYAAAAGSAASAVLDTDSDGLITENDDPYAPYYPGDAYVDWVGMSLYHWGSAHPWGENEVPESGKFAAQLTGTYSGMDGDETAVPDFYTDYGSARGKPVAIPETAALVVPRGDAAGETAIRQAWWRQIFAEETHQKFPMLRLVNWFEWIKFEPEVDETWPGRCWTTNQRDSLSRGIFLGGCGSAGRRRARTDRLFTHYLRSVRLAPAHARLGIGSRGDADTVAAIARTVDLAHVSRFAAAYRAAYGESPGRTLGP